MHIDCAYKWVLPPADVVTTDMEFTSVAEEGLEFDFDDSLIIVLFWLQTHLHVVAFVYDSDDVESTVPVSQVELIFGRIFAR